MVIEPRVLLLDEPLSNLDANLREEMRFEILAALGFFLLGATILIVLIGYKIIGRDFMLRRS